MKQLKLKRYANSKRMCMTKLEANAIAIESINPQTPTTKLVQPAVSITKVNAIKRLATKEVMANQLSIRSKLPTSTN